MNSISQYELKKAIAYIPDTGEFFWKVDRFGPVKKGTKAGNIRKDGYVYLQVNKIGYLAHRLAFIYMTGSLPSRNVDHINRNTSDNRWLNLRLCSHSQNMANTRRRVDNTSGYKGVSWLKREKKWRSYIRHKGKQINLGYFDTSKEAAIAYSKKAKELFGEFAYVND